MFWFTEAQNVVNEFLNRLNFFSVFEILSIWSLNVEILLCDVGNCELFRLCKEGKAIVYYVALMCHVDRGSIFLVGVFC